MKRLYLNQHDKKICGLCAGIADYLEIDVTVVRLLTIILALATWVVPTFLGYLIIASITPKEGEVKHHAKAQPPVHHAAVGRGSDDGVHHVKKS